MFAHHPEIAKRFAAETPKGAKLPEHVKSGGIGMGKKYGDRPLSKMFSKAKGK